MAYFITDSLPHLVLDLCRHQHILKVHPKRPPEAGNPYSRTVRICVNMVHPVGLYVHSVPISEEKYTGTEEWDPPADSRCYHGGDALGRVPVNRPHTQLYGYLADSRLTGPHYQRTFASLYCPGVPPFLPHTVRPGYLSVANSIDPRRHACVFYWVLDELLRYSVCACRCINLCLAEYFLQEALQ